MSAAPDREKLLAYLDGELDASARAEVEARVHASREWRMALEEERALSAALAAMPQIDPSPQFEARFWARVAREEARPGWSARLSEWFTGARLGAAAGLVGAAAIVLFLTLRTPGVAELAEDETWIVASADFELLQEDVELLELMDILEEWDGTET